MCLFITMAQVAARLRPAGGVRARRRHTHTVDFRNFTVFFPKDCHVPSGCLLEMSNGLSVALSNGVSLCDFRCVIFNIYIYIYIYYNVIIYNLYL